MGRRKIEIQPLTDDRNRTVTFTKRKAGLFKKAHELSILCQVDVSVIIIGKKNKIYEYSSNRTNEILNEYRKNQNNLYEVKTPHNYGDYELKSRVEELEDDDTINSSNHNMYTHKHSNSANNIQIPLHQSMKGHSRSKSENVQVNSFKQGLKRSDDGNNKTATNIGDNDSEDDDDDEDEDDSSHMNDRSKSNNNFMHNGDRKYSHNDTINQPFNYKHKIQDTNRNIGANKKIKLEVEPSSSYSELSPVIPQTPEMESNRLSQTFTAITPMYKRIQHNDGNSETRKDKDTANTVHNAKRPTLSLQIPTVEEDNAKSNPSTITAAESSNKSNMTKSFSSMGSKSSVQFKESTDIIEKNNDGDSEINKSIESTADKAERSNEINSNMRNFNGNSNNKLLSSGYPFNSVGTNPNLSTPLSTSFLKDRKNIYTPITTSFLNSLNTNADTPLNQLNYFNFNGMSPTQLLTPMFPFPMSATTAPINSIPDTQSNSNTNPNNNTSNTNNLENPNNVGLGVVMNNNNSNSNNNNNNNNNMVTTNKSELQRNKRDYTQAPQTQQPFLHPMNSATSMYFPQMRINNPRTTPSSIMNASSTPKNTINLSAISSKTQNINTDLNKSTLTSTINHQSTSEGKVEQVNKHDEHNTNSSNISTTTHNNAKNSSTVRPEGPQIELPSLSTGEMYSLPSRYVEFQSPNTLFSHDWQLNSDGTPIAAAPPPSVLTNTSSSANKGKSSLLTKTEIEDDINRS